MLFSENYVNLSWFYVNRWYNYVNFGETYVNQHWHYVNQLQSYVNLIFHYVNLIFSEKQSNFAKSTFWTVNFSLCKPCQGRFYGPYL